MAEATSEKYTNTDGSISYVTRFDEHYFMVHMQRSIIDETIRIVAKAIADDIIANKMPEIMEKISADAIATMAVAEAGAAVNETLHKKLPDKILEIERTREKVYQRGILGGLKRIK